MTRRERFLGEMDQVVPWAELCVLIEPVYPKPKGAGRRPIGLERMLRIYFMQQWFNLSDPAVEEALYDSRAMRASSFPSSTFARGKSCSSFAATPPT